MKNMKDKILSGSAIFIITCLIFLGATTVSYLTIDSNCITDQKVLFTNILCRFYGDISESSGIPSFFPSQDGNNGKYLQTDGSAISWQTVAGATQSIYNYTQDFTITTSFPSNSIVTNFGSSSDIKGTLAGDLPDGFGVTLVNQSPVVGGVEEPTPNTLISTAAGWGGSKVTLADMTDGVTAGASSSCYTNSPAAGKYIGFEFSAAKTLSRIRFFTYATSGRIATFKIERYNGGGWTKVPITGVGANTSIINTDEGQYDLASTTDGWADVEFEGVEDTQFRIWVLSRAAGDENAGVSEIEMYAGSYRLSLAPPTGGQLAGTSAINRLKKSSALNDCLKTRIVNMNYQIESAWPSDDNWADAAE